MHPILHALSVAAEARESGRDADAEVILQGLEDDGAWEFECWRSETYAAISARIGRDIDTLNARQRRTGLRVIVYADAFADESPRMRQTIAKKMINAMRIGYA